MSTFKSLLFLQNNVIKYNNEAELLPYATIVGVATNDKMSIDYSSEPSSDSLFYICNMDIAPSVCSGDHTVLPISLQELCYMYLIGHLNLYSVDYLALLPVILRRQLLARLPAVDVHRLETTRLFEDISTTPYWEALYKCYKEQNCSPSTPASSFVLSPQLNWHKEDNEDEGSSKQLWLHQVVKDMVSSQANRQDIWSVSICNIKEVLLRSKMLAFFLSLRCWSLNDTLTSYNDSCLHQLFEQTGLILVHPICNLIVPKRLSSQYGLPWHSSTDHINAIVDILVTHFHKFPQSICLDLHNMYSDSITANIDIPSVHKFIAGTNRLHVLCCRGYFPNTFKAEDTLRALCSIEVRSHIKSLVIGGSYHDREMCGHHFRELQSYFVPGYLADTKYSPCTMLEEISVNTLINEKKPMKGSRIPSNHPLLNLASIISHQQNLKRMKLNLQLSHPDSQQLMSVLNDLIQQPQFESLKIDCPTDCDVAVESIAQLLVSFLTTSTTKIQVLSLVFRQAQLIHTKSTSKVLSELVSKIKRGHITPDVQQMKKLYIGNFHYINKELIGIIKRFHPMCLHTFGSPIYQGFNFYSDIPHITASNIMIDGIFFEKNDSNPKTKKVVEQQLDIIFKQTSLMRVSFVRFELLSTLDHVSSFAKAIGDHASQVKTLQCIQFVNCFKCNCDTTVLRIFFQALIELALSTNLEIDLNENYFDQNELELFCMLWKQFPNRKQFRKLIWHLDYKMSDSNHQLLKETSVEFVSVVRDRFTFVYQSGSII